MIMILSIWMVVYLLCHFLLYYKIDALYSFGHAFAENGFCSCSNISVYQINSVLATFV